MLKNRQLLNTEWWNIFASHNYTWHRNRVLLMHFLFMISQYYHTNIEYVTYYTKSKMVWEMVMGNFPVQRQFSSWYSSVFKLLSELTARALWFNWIILHPRWHGLKKVTFVPFGIVAQAGIYSFVPHGHSRSGSAEHWPYIWLLLKGCSSTEVFGDALFKVTHVIRWRMVTTTIGDKLTAWYPGSINF